ncbi:MAG: hypothetical protein HYV52_02210 [Parcubacteria group bacterium]|nr:hypothetical protein [Parcubacteria group bacterium]
MFFLFLAILDNFYTPKAVSKITSINLSFVSFKTSAIFIFIFLIITGLFIYKFHWQPFLASLEAGGKAQGVKYVSKEMLDWYKKAYERNTYLSSQIAEDVAQNTMSLAEAGIYDEQFFKESSRIIEEAFLKEPSYIRLGIRIERIYLLLFNYDKSYLDRAEKILNILIAEAPAFPYLKNDLGRVKLAKGENKEAFEFFRQSAEQAPNINLDLKIQ